MSKSPIQTKCEHEWHAFHVAPPDGPPIQVGIRCVKCGLYKGVEQRHGEEPV